MRHICAPSFVILGVMLMLSACAASKTPEDKLVGVFSRSVECAASHMRLTQALHTPVTAGTATEKQIKAYNNLVERIGNDLKMAIDLQGKEKTNTALTEANKTLDNLLVSKGPDESAKIIADYSLECAKVGL